MTAVLTRRISEARCRVAEVDLTNLDATFIKRWRELESRSLEGNAFRSPDLVIPASKLTSVAAHRPLVLAVDSDNDELMALGVFEVSRGNRLLPMTHLQGWQSDYSLSDGLLVDRLHAGTALAALFRFVADHREWNGLAFENRTADSALAGALDRAADATGASWHEDWQIERAIIPVNEIPEGDIFGMYSKSRRKSLKRNIRRLQSHGTVSYRLVCPEPGDHRAVGEFLRLEALGWKGKEGTALAADSQHEQFCRELVDGFAANTRTVFGELCIDGRPIASTLNLLSGETLFAMKIGWDPTLAECSPGTLSELCLLQHCKQLSGVKLIDSCAKPGSYVDNIWPWRQKLTTGVFTTSMTGTLAASALGRIKHLKRLLK